MCKFEQLVKKNVNEFVEKKGRLAYLSWANAWKVFKTFYPEAQYEVKTFEGGKPYLYDENLGYMVFTSVTADNQTYEMWLPVMDNCNKAMKEKATMFEINTAIMRCLTKNLAMFGLGLYIYAGEDLPDLDGEQQEAEPKKEVVVSKTEKPTFKCEECGKVITSAENRYSFDKFGKALCRDCQKKASQNS